MLHTGVFSLQGRMFIELITQTLVRNTRNCETAYIGTRKVHSVCVCVCVCVSVCVCVCVCACVCVCVCGCVCGGVCGVCVCVCVCVCVDKRTNFCAANAAVFVRNAVRVSLLPNPPPGKIKHLHHNYVSVRLCTALNGLWEVQGEAVAF